MTPDVKLLGVTHVSNVLGTVNPVREICREARKRGIVTVVDGSQAAAAPRGRHRRDRLRFLRLHRPQDVRPDRHRRAVGAARAPAAMPPFIGGGEMIREVRFEGTVFNDAPHKFEAGTPNIAGFIGLGAAVDYLVGLGMANIEAREQRAAAHATEELSKVDGLRIFGSARERPR